MPIAGTGSPWCLADDAGALDVELTDADLVRLPYKPIGSHAVHRFVTAWWRPGGWKGSPSFGWTGLFVRDRRLGAGAAASGAMVATMPPVLRPQKVGRTAAAAAPPFVAWNGFVTCPMCNWRDNPAKGR